MPFYSGKVWFLSGKNINFTSKTNFSTEKTIINAVLKWKSMVFICKNINFTSKTNFSTEKTIINAVLQWKRWFLSVKT